MSTYIIERDPNRFSGKQDDYVKRSNQLVDETITHFQEAVRQGKDLTHLFHETLAELGKARKQIAKDHQYIDEKIEFFGSRRDDPKIFKSPTPVTVLTDPYEEYNDSLMARLQGYLRPMKHTFRAFEQKERIVHEKSCFGRANSVSISIYSGEEQEKWAGPLTVKEIREVGLLCDVVLPPEVQDISTLSRLLVSDINAMKKLKEKHSDVYKKVKLMLGIAQLKLVLPERRKSDFALITVRSQIGDKMYALSQYLTWMYRDFKIDPVERMSYHSKIALVHQDPFLIEPMLQDIAKLFKEAIECSKDDLKTLKEKSILLQYELAHAMPFARGNSAIAEWIERAIYGYHGYDVEYNQKQMVNLEALTSSLAAFAENYDSLVHLTKKTV